MATIQETKVCLRIFGDNLAPDSITEKLGHPPTHAESKGDEIVGKKSGRVRIAKSGGWRLQANNAVPGDLNAQISELLDKLTMDENVWTEIALDNKIDIFCGLFMGGGIEGECISAHNLLALGKRQIELNLDIYGPSEA